MNEQPVDEKKSEKKGMSVDVQRLKGVVINFLVPLIAIGVSGGLALVVFLPSYNSLPKVKQELEQKERLMNTLAEKSKALARLADFKSVVAEDSELINKVLVSEAEPLALQDQLYQMVLSSGMIVNKLAYSAGGRGVTEEGSYSLVAQAIGGEASYSQLLRFMELVENAARFIQATGFRFGSNRDTGMLNININLEAPYLYVESSAVTDDPIGLDIGSDEFVSFINRLKGLKYYSFSEPVEIPEEVVVESDSTPEEIPAETPVEVPAP